MSYIVNEIDQRIASRVKQERESRGWSLAQLAEASAVSKAMISRIERNEVSATAALLGRLSGAFGLTVASLLGPPEEGNGKLRRKAAQEIWRDPATKFTRTAISPPAARRLQLVHGELPPLARIAYPASSYGFFTQQIWVLEGQLVFDEGKMRHVLEVGDCLELSEPQDCAFENASANSVCRYLVALSL